VIRVEGTPGTTVLKLWKVIGEAGKTANMCPQLASATKQKRGAFKTGANRAGLFKLGSFEKFLPAGFLAVLWIENLKPLITNSYSLVVSGSSRVKLIS
jgi:hypothetical protein